MKNPQSTPIHPELELFFASAIARAQAAADACIALHRTREVDACPVPTPEEIRELEEACDRWIAKRANRQERAA
jgi:hypothetical protein